MSSSVAVTRLKDLKIDGSQDMIKVDPRTITVEADFNPRDFDLPANRLHVDNLKASIKEHGVQQPLWVRWSSDTKEAILIDGECRLRATLELIAEGAEIVSVPVIQKSLGVSSIADRLIHALTANESLHISQAELGKTYIRLVNYGWGEGQIAKKVGKSERFVRDSIALADAPEAVKALVASGAVTKALALKEVKKYAEGAVAALEMAVKEAKADGKTVAKAAKKDTTKDRLNQIAVIMQSYEAAGESDVKLTFNKLAGYLADIADVLSGEFEMEAAA